MHIALVTQDALRPQELDIQEYSLKNLV